MMLSDVCRVHPVSGRRVRPAGWMARIGWSGPARPAWLAQLKAAAARFRRRPGRGHIVAAARLQLVWSCCMMANKLYGRPPQYAPPLQVVLLTLKVVSESHTCMTWATSVPISVFLLTYRLRPDVRDRQTSNAQHRL